MTAVRLGLSSRHVCTTHPRGGGSFLGGRLSHWRCEHPVHHSDPAPARMKWIVSELPDVGPRENQEDDYREAEKRQQLGIVVLIAFWHERLPSGTHNTNDNDLKNRTRSAPSVAVKFHPPRMFEVGPWGNVFDMLKSSVNRPGYCGCLRIFDFDPGFRWSGLGLF